MRAVFKVVHFAPNPFSGWRVPVGALVRTSDKVQFVASEWLPGPQCLGSEAAHSLVQVVASRLAVQPEFERLPIEAGPQMLLAEECAVPQSVEDPAKWVAEAILPRPPPLDSRPRSYAGRRETVGRRFLETYQVSSFVQRRFLPSDLGRSIPERSAGPVTHYVVGKEEILLLEPLVSTRDRFERELEEVSQTFLAYRQLFAEAERREQPRFVAYAFPYGRGESVQLAREVLQRHRFEVYDVDQPPERDALLAGIRTLAASAGLAN